MIQAGTAFRWFVGAAVCALLSYYALLFLMVLRSSDIGFSGSYLSALIPAAMLVTVICFLVQKVKIPVTCFLVAVAGVHITFTCEEQAFRRTHAGRETGPIPRFMSNTWFAVDSAGRLTGGD